MRSSSQNSIKKLIKHNQQKKYLHSSSTIPEDTIKKQIICIELKRLKQIIKQYKKQTLSEEDLVRIIKSQSLGDRQLQIKKNEMQLPNELAYLNKIKQNNQRVLKNKIKQLQGRLFSNPSKQIYLGHINERPIQEIEQLKKNLQNKDRKIQEYQRLIQNLERKKSQLQNNVHRFQAQSEKMKLKEEQNRKKMQKFKMQLDEIKSKQKKIKKIHHKYSITRNLQVKINPSMELNESKIQQGSSKQQLLKQQIISLYTTNSILRKQLIQLHELIDEQDTKYEKKLQYMQNKIKKLTQFNSQRRDKQDLNSSTYSTQPINTVTPRKRNSDMIDYKYRSRVYQANQEEKEKSRDNLHEKKDKSRIIRIADFQIEFELANEHPTRANNIKYKPMQINVESSSSYNKN